MKEKGHAIFENDARPYNLNIIGIRGKNLELDKFGDQLLVSYKYKGEWIDHSFKITTAPGSYYLINKLLNSKGAAILAPGQYRGIYGIRKHNGKYDALCQTWGPVKVFRDGNRDRKFDLNPEKTFWGNYGINIHRSVLSGCAMKVGSHSAGCQVFSCASDFNFFMSLCVKSRNNFGNKFTYTLVDE